MTKDTFDNISFQQAHELDCKRKPLNCPKNCGAVVPREEVRIKCCYYCSLTFVRSREMHYGRGLTLIFSTYFSGYVYELRELLKQADDFEW